jgi:hypothetical protein
MTNEPGGASKVHQQVALSAALYAKQSALGQANVCISGDTTPEKDQHADNQREVGELILAIQRVASGNFKWPGDAAVAQLPIQSNALKGASQQCVNKLQIIHDCQALIAFVPASSI